MIKKTQPTNCQISLDQPVSLLFKKLNIDLGAGISGINAGKKLLDIGVNKYAIFDAGKGTCNIH